MRGRALVQPCRRASRLAAAVRSASAAAGCIAVAACASIASQEADSGTGAPATTIAHAGSARVPADVRRSPGDAEHLGARTYSGTYSCDGCVERRITVTVFADGSYRLREAPAQGDPVNEEGRWRVDLLAPDRLVLETAGGARVMQRSAPDELTLVDPEGRELHGLIGGVLRRSARVDPLPVSVRLVGSYRSGDAGAVFVDCASGETLAVLPGLAGSAQAALDAAWRELSPRGGETVLVVVRAHRVAEAAPEAIVVDSFERATRDGRCNGPLSKP